MPRACITPNKVRTACLRTRRARLACFAHRADLRVVEEQLPSRRCSRSDSRIDPLSPKLVQLDQSGMLALSAGTSGSHPCLPPMVTAAMMCWSSWQRKRAAVDRLA
jgi:hypothetical protein